VAERSGELLTQAQQFRAATQECRVVNSGAESDHDDEIPASGSLRIEQGSIPEQAGDVASNQSSTGFLRGTIVSVDCSSRTVATLTVLSGGKNWKMRVQDSKHVAVIGAGSFSCSWDQRKIALNYRETGDATGNVISIEIQ